MDLAAAEELATCAAEYPPTLADGAAGVLPVAPTGGNLCIKTGQSAASMHPTPGWQLLDTTGDHSPTAQQQVLQHTEQLDPQPQGETKLMEAGAVDAEPACAAPDGLASEWAAAALLQQQQEQQQQAATAPEAAQAAAPAAEPAPEWAALAAAQELGCAQAAAAQDPAAVPAATVAGDAAAGSAGAGDPAAYGASYWDPAGFYGAYASSYYYGGGLPHPLVWHRLTLHVGMLLAAQSLCAS